MDSLADLIDIYVKAWNDDDPQHRQHLLAPIWAENAIFTDPRNTIRGLDALLDHITAVRAARPAPLRLTRTSDVTLHDHPHPGPFFFTWETRSEANRCLTEGVALGERDAQGRLRCIQHGPVAQHPEPPADSPPSPPA